MAGIKSELLEGVAASMRDRQSVRGESQTSDNRLIRGEYSAPSSASPASDNRLIRGEYSAPTVAGKSSLERQTEGRRRLDTACVIRVDRIAADPHQPRTEFEPEALARLADSLKSRGQLQPIRVRWEDAIGFYVVVVGERRWRAARLAGLETLACVVVTGSATPEDLFEDQLVENCLREDLRPIEQARAFKALLASRGLSQRQLAERLQIGQATISKALALLGLPQEIQGAVDAGMIGPDAAYQLSKVEDPTKQAELARSAARGEMKRDEVKAKATRPRATKGRGAKPRKVTTRVIRTAAGPRVTVEFARGLTPELIRAAIDAVRDVLDAEAGDRAAA